VKPASFCPANHTRRRPSVRSSRLSHQLRPTRPSRGGGASPPRRVVRARRLATSRRAWLLWVRGAAAQGSSSKHTQQRRRTSCRAASGAAATAASVAAQRARRPAARSDGGTRPSGACGCHQRDGCHQRLAGACAAGRPPFAAPDGAWPARVAPARTVTPAARLPRPLAAAWCRAATCVLRAAVARAVRRSSHAGSRGVFRRARRAPQPRTLATVPSHTHGTAVRPPLRQCDTQSVQRCGMARVLPLLRTRARAAHPAAGPAAPPCGRRTVHEASPPLRLAQRLPPAARASSHLQNVSPAQDGVPCGDVASARERTAGARSAPSSRATTPFVSKTLVPRGRTPVQRRCSDGRTGVARVPPRFAAAHSRGARGWRFVSRPPASASPRL
jgi:hypothetical protein